MILGKDDYIVGAWAESHAGPGWSNYTVSVCVCDKWSGRYRVETLQPDEMSLEIHTLFGVCRAASSALIGAVHRLAETSAKVSKNKTPRKPRR